MRRHVSCSCQLEAQDTRKMVLIKSRARASVCKQFSEFMLRVGCCACLVFVWHMLLPSCWCSEREMLAI